MNNIRRRSLEEAAGLLERVSNIVSISLDKEEDCLENMPENFQESARGEEMELAIDNMEEAVSRIDEAKELILEAIEK